MISFGGHTASQGLGGMVGFAGHTAGCPMCPSGYFCSNGSSCDKTGGNGGSAGSGMAGFAGHTAGCTMCSPMCAWLCGTGGAGNGGIGGTSSGGAGNGGAGNAGAGNGGTAGGGMSGFAGHTSACTGCSPNCPWLCGGNGGTGATGGGGSGGDAGNGGTDSGGMAGFAGHTQSCGGLPCGAGGSTVGGASGAGGSSMAMSAPIVSAAMHQGCYALTGYEPDPCLPGDDSLTSWLTGLPGGCKPHVESGPRLTADFTGRQCCYAVSCAGSITSLGAPR